MKSTPLVCCVVFLLAFAGKAASQERAEGAPAETIVMTYAIDDLIQAARHYPFRSDIVPPTQIISDDSHRQPQVHGGGGGGGGGLFSGGSEDEEEERDDSELAQEVIDVIQNSVLTDSWRNNGGTMGSIVSFRGRLIVSHTEEVHRQIASLLAEIRQSLGAVTVRAFWVRLTDEQAAQPGKIGEVVAVQPDLVEYQAQTTCFNGQMVYVASGRGKSIVLESTPIVGTNSIGYQINSKLLHIGAILQVKPMVDRETKTVVLDLRSVVSQELAEARDEPGVGVEVRSSTFNTDTNDVATVHATSVDRVNLAVQHFNTTTKAALNAPIVVAGSTLRGADDNATPLYLVIEVIAE